MRKGRDGEKMVKNGGEENNDENSGPLTSLPVDRLNGDRLQRRRSCQNQSHALCRPDKAAVKSNIEIFSIL